MEYLDKMFILTVQNIGKNLKICKWSIMFSFVGITINLFLNSFIFIKIKNENESLNQKIKLLLNETNVILQNNVSINDNIKSINKNIISINEFKKFTHKVISMLDENDKLNDHINNNVNDKSIDDLDSNYDFIY
jgi:cell division protein FtsX